MTDQHLQNNIVWINSLCRHYSRQRSSPRVFGRDGAERQILASPNDKILHCRDPPIPLETIEKHSGKLLNFLDFFSLLPFFKNEGWDPKSSLGHPKGYVPCGLSRTSPFPSFRPSHEQLLEFPLMLKAGHHPTWWDSVWEDVKPLYGKCCLVIWGRGKDIRALERTNISFTFKFHLTWTLPEFVTHIHISCTHVPS